MAFDDKKYQIFVSSTYVDLQEERQEVMHALLELDCIPSGMELFPAADEDQWSLIKGVIDDCDYYIVILGGRYGSIGVDGLSYTEMEYRYAVESGKPVAAFLHGNPASIPSGKCESTEEGKKKLEAFRELAQQKICKHWTTPHELGSVVSRSLVALRKQHPGVGWIRGDKVSSTDSMAEILKLRNRIDELEAELNESRTRPPEGTAGLAQGDEEFGINVSYESRKWDIADYEYFEWNELIWVTWKELFFLISPLLLHEATTRILNARITGEIQNKVLGQFKDDGEKPLDENHKGHTVDKVDINVSQTDLETILVQFLALGYIKRSEEARSVKDRETYWTLTPFGNTVMNQLRAVKSIA